MKTSVSNRRYLLFLAFLTAFLASTTHAQIFTGTGFTIVDNGARVATSCSTVLVSGITTSVNVRSVSLTNASHSWLGDIEVRLYPPATAAPPSTAGTTVISSPPDGRACNLSGTYRFIDSAAQSIDAATVGCLDATNLAAGDYRTSTYGGGVNPGPVTSLTTTFGALTPVQANGNWLVCVFDFASPDGGTIGGTSIQLTVLSAANASVGGRVVTSGGLGIPKTNVTVTDPSGNIAGTITNSFGYYRFDDLQVGQIYILTVSSKIHQFENASRVINLTENITDADFISLP